MILMKLSPSIFDQSGQLLLVLKYNLSVSFLLISDAHIFTQGQKDFSSKYTYVYLCMCMYMYMIIYSSNSTDSYLNNAEFS